MYREIIYNTDIKSRVKVIRRRGSGRYKGIKRKEG